MRRKTAASAALLILAALVSLGRTVLIRNAGATNAQVMVHNNVASGEGATGSGATSTAVQTNAGGVINIGCQTSTATTDTCALLGYTIELVPGA